MSKLRTKDTVIQKENVALPYAWMTVILCWSAVVVMSSLYVTIPLVPLFAKVFGKTLAEAALPGSIFSLGFAAGCLIYGGLSDRFGRKQIIVAGLLALTILSLSLSLTSQYSVLVALRLLQGLAAATFSPVALAYAVDMFPTEKRVTAIGFISTGFLVAGIAGQVFSIIISEQIGWNMVFRMLGVLYAITFLIVLFFLPKAPSPQRGVRIWAAFGQLGTVLRSYPLWLSYTIAFVLLMSFVSMYTVLGSYLGSPEFGLNSRQMLYVRSAGIIGMLLSPFAGKLALKFDVHLVLRTALLLSILSLALMGMTHSLIAIVVLSVCFVSGIALSVPSLITIVGQLGGAARAIAVSLYTFILFAGTSIAPMLSIRLMGNGGNQMTTFMLLAAVLSVGLIASLLIRRRQNDPLERDA
ncbi:MFS transporter [Paenibacillus sp. EKM102P]|uniref:MFS transporter n=1 Tax=unclassified Paenibacillus TaxID=185978 RepID=UPI00142E33A2|nr:MULTISPECIES: MFS transporter [unclassified Paenibacillus]KAF6615809.1 MFS transporter [Paenibacillus sp. EKM101P]KAF6620726.1 MFS transporter [Paenibacillus sp. EKM102P]KAF6629086.1 MFS transporter [Paenibacillus sp. EKM10P]KAF6644870.1 MFS transporter [Paenibacillus sp. EKM11P]